jgi:hypothetical protein
MGKNYHEMDDITERLVWQSLKEFY